MARLILALLPTLLFAAGRTYTVHAMLLSADLASKTMVVSEAAIPGFMDAMTMSYRLRDTKPLASLKPGMKVEFTLSVDADASTVTNLHAVRYESMDREPLQARSLGLLQTAIDKKHSVPPIQVGDVVPDFTLIDQTGAQVSLSQFAGKVIAVTFVYTRCPLPDYCLRLSNNFGLLQRRFHDRMAKDLILLSITFDPVHDTPDVLATYARIWNADANGWHLLTGPVDQVTNVCNRMGSNFWQSEGVLAHSLHTLVINRERRLVANVEGNQFSAQQLGDLVERYF